MVLTQERTRKPVRIRRRHDAQAVNPSSTGTASGDAVSEEDDTSSTLTQINPPGCRHYSRRCKLVCPFCEIPFPCRFCHDEIFDVSSPDEQLLIYGNIRMPPHKIDRNAVTEVVCVDCDHRQPVAPTCAKCNVTFGAYFCLKCNFFDNDVTKKIWHCEKCGLCRVGGQENYFHCENCDGCYPLALQGKHKCLTQAMRGDCPICLESMFDSTKSVCVLRKCGHTLHDECFRQHRECNYNIRNKCPLCLAVHSPGSSGSEDWDTEEVIEETATNNV
eukprot:Gregarina_sp_Pseudo_9__5904@NODE_935_length_2053_cov_34_058093_g877_i0_p1_GENE_NODE_935_length_2053_cov_34_058093_g877_i0NODE_935_length_2053_cov_34_058093_g877_i0_p1_ORF_typecomplete_len286_score24_88zfCHY/PF05495_12/3e20zfCHY/PF05495_12/1_8e04zfRING_2/PF13639_6/1_6e03zfRING_2/PF13639_6/1_8e04zfRING_2/PF13639_6/7e08zfC3HC4_2/PF13923_6/8_9e03zfC3HC4_2/PF13923_6/5_6e03zfC3HC4_2/PF13923_6/1_8e04zfC3HC4_2/PF13923_6/1_8e04zfC3HC4_2/PF13923_6/1_1e05zfRING_UBOX/PF13445_6/1_8e04zfRING_UBOX/PF13445_6/1_